MPNYPTNIPVHLLDSEHYRQMLVADGQRRYQEWHNEYLRHQKEFLNDQHQRINELENLRHEIHSDHKRRSQESREEFLRYQQKYLKEMRRY